MFPTHHKYMLTRSSVLFWPDNIDLPFDHWAYPDTCEKYDLFKWEPNKSGRCEIAAGGRPVNLQKLQVDEAKAQDMFVWLRSLGLDEKIERPVSTRGTSIARAESSGARCFGSQGPVEISMIDVSDRLWPKLPIMLWSEILAIRPPQKGMPLVHVVNASVVASQLVPRICVKECVHLIPQSWRAIM